ncbi:MAG: non-canonical purine NTP pyrophosphatase [Suilimivivens sp.]
MELIYGTGNPAKLKFMKRVLEGLPCELIGLTEAAEREKINLPEIRETGNSPLENAAIKAKAYYELFGKPVFSCDSGLYLWNHETGEMLPKALQPGIHVRGSGKKRLTDEDLIAHYTELVRKFGPILARYKNGICLIMDEEHIYESMEEALWGVPFLLTDTPHQKRIPGFPLDSISLEITSGKYYYDLEENSQDDVAAENGFREFFKNRLFM